MLVRCFKCAGNLMTETGLKEILELEFAGVPKLLTGIFLDMLEHLGL
jgi:hypothetical protein